MQLILDNIAAIMIGSAVILIVLSTQFQAQRAATEQTIALISKTATLDLGRVLEEDLIVLGSGTSDTITDIQESGDSLTTVFEFRKLDELGTEIEVTYRLTDANVVTIRGEAVQLYTLDRYEDDVWAGGGGDHIRFFSISMLNTNGHKTSGVASARLLRVRLVNVYPYGEDDGSTIFQSHWGITVRPEGLAP